MRETLEEFIRRRISEIDEACAALNSERGQLVIAAAAAGIDVPPPLGVQLAQRRAPPRATSGTIKKAVLDVLLRHDRPMQTQEILREINQLLETNYPRSSLSPQLSRLKADGKVTHDGTAWALAPLGSQ